MFTTYTHKLKDGQPFYVKPYPIPMNFKNKVRAEVKKMLKFNIVRHSTSSYINSVTVVSKTDNSVRLCHDAQKLNTKLYKDHESPPRIELIFQKYQINQFVFTMDHMSSLWQVSLDKRSQKYIAFIIDSKVMNLDLSICSAALIQALDYAVDVLSENAAQKTAHLQTKLCLHTQSKNQKLKPNEMKILLTEVMSKLKLIIKNLSDSRKPKIILNQTLTDEERSFSVQLDYDVGICSTCCTLTDPNNLLRRLDKRISYEVFIKRKEKESSWTKGIHLLLLLVIFLLILFFFQPWTQTQEVI